MERCAVAECGGEECIEMLLSQYIVANITIILCCHKITDARRQGAPGDDGKNSRDFALPNDQKNKVGKACDVVVFHHCVSL